jgi:tight adherence protein B
MSDMLRLYKAECVALLFVAAVLFGYDLLSRPESMVRRAYPLYVAYLNRRLHFMLLPQIGARIVALQATAFAAALLLCAAIGDRRVLLAAVLIVFAPTLCLRVMHGQRIERINEQVDGFLLTLANALRATPSLGNALASTEGLLVSPLNKELSVTLQELRLGNNLEQALLNMSARVQSPVLDSGVSALLIGKQVGGDLAKVLETTAATLRELRRLQGVLKTKTAEARAQMWALALIPPVLVWGLEAVMPGYFDPLLEVFIGKLVIAAAVVLWALSLWIARAILKVEL